MAVASPPVLFDGIDTKTSLLISHLALEDIEIRIRSYRQGTDQRYALEVEAEDYRRFLQAYKDYQSTGHGDADTRSLTSSEVSFGTAEGIDAPLLDPPSPSQLPMSNSREPVTEPPIQRLVDCIACADKIRPTSTFRASCGHHFCEPCLEQFLETSATAESLFPPWCCTPSQKLDLSQLMTADGHSLPNSGNGPLISEDLCHRLYNKLAEYAVPQKDRVYCPNSRCSVFMGSKDSLQGSLTSSINAPKPTSQCRSCCSLVCLGCKEPKHTGGCWTSTTEEYDEAYLAFRDLAKKREWQKCPGCCYVVEKRDGCNHIVCRCKREFCYRCGRDWSSTHVCP